jgi:ribosomal protein L7Ae-like RNA K-turn-binding protein
MNGQVTYLLEVASLDMRRTSAELRSQLEVTGFPVRIVGELDDYPGIVVEVDAGTASELQNHLLLKDSRLEIVELRRHFRTSNLSTDSLVRLIAQASKAARLAVGASAVERAIQRRRLELLVVANDLAEPYAAMLRTVIETTGCGSPLIVASLSRTELGRPAGVHRTGCVGILRGSRRVGL